MPIGANNQAAKSFIDFLRRIPKTPAVLRKEAPAPPSLPLVIRVGAAGHLKIEFEATVQRVVQDIFEAMRRYAESQNGHFHKALFDRIADLPEPEVRLVCQLAPGLDQIAARTAALDSVGFRLHVVLPGTREHFERSLRQLEGQTSEGTRVTEGRRSVHASYRESIRRADRVLELDSIDESGDFSDADYEQAANVILANCDLLLVAIHDSADDHAGGTKWMESTADKLNLPVIRIPVEDPKRAELIWTERGIRRQADLYESANDVVSQELFCLPLNEILAESTGPLGHSCLSADADLGSPVEYLPRPRQEPLSNPTPHPPWRQQRRHQRGRLTPP